MIVGSAEWHEILGNVSPLIIFVLGGIFTMLSGLFVSWYSKILKGQLIFFKDESELMYYEKGYVTVVNDKGNDCFPVGGEGTLIIAFSILNHTNEKCIIASLEIWAGRERIHYYMATDDVIISVPSSFHDRRGYAQDVDPKNIAIELPAMSKRRVSIVTFPQTNIDNFDELTIRYKTSEPRVLPLAKKREQTLKVINAKNDGFEK